MAKARKKPPEPSKFSVGTQVRVKAGTTDPDFPNVPLGGWVGIVREVYPQETPPTYLLAWDASTRKQMHPSYRKRCDREGLDPDLMTLAENDLDLDDGKPVAIVQPAALPTRPLDLADEEDRVRAALGIDDHDEPLPDIDEDSLRAYYKYLVTRLKFPFPAKASDPYRSDDGERVRVLRLIDPDDDDYWEEGLSCKAEQNGERIEVPLDEIDVEKGDPNRQLVEDYAFWFANYR